MDATNQNWYIINIPNEQCKSTRLNKVYLGQSIYTNIKIQQEAIKITLFV